MNYCEIKNCDVADGIGVRISLFVSGCRNHCKGCFQPETWNFNYGKEFTKETEDYLLELLKPDYIDGLTLLGGDPFEPENEERLVPFLERIKTIYPNKNIWCYSGYLYDDLKNRPMIKYIDVLVDGRFVEELKDITLKFRGSSNQRIIDVKSSSIITI